MDEIYRELNNPSCKTSLDAYRIGKKYGYNKAINDMLTIIKEMRETATAMGWAESESACDRFIIQAEKLRKI